MKSKNIMAVLHLIILIAGCSQPAIPDPTSTTNIEPSSPPTGQPGYPIPPELIFHPSPVPAYPEPPDQPTPTSFETGYPVPESSPTPAITSDENNFLWVSTGADLYNRVVTIDAQNPENIAYCARDVIRHSLDGGQTWAEIPTSGVSTVAESMGYQMYQSDPAFSDSCLSVLLDPEFFDTFYAVFTAAHGEYGAPPVFYMAFFTTDRGESWGAVPPPSTSNYESFSGFWTTPGKPVEALFSVPEESAGIEQPISVQITVDGGQTWETGELACPSTGPCLRWGAAVSNVPGMGSPLPQEILVSQDQGKTWDVIEPPVELRAPMPNQLVAFSDEQAKIISGSIVLSTSADQVSPVRTTHDSGQTWQELPIPSLGPGGEIQEYFPGLQILPDGSYISQSIEQNAWFWLPEPSDTWCLINDQDLPKIPVLLQSSIDRLWWVDQDTGEALSFHYSDIACTDS